MMTETQIALQVGLMGRGRAVVFLQSLLAQFQGTPSKGASEAPIHGMSAAEDAATDEQAVKDWSAPIEEGLHAKAVNYIFTHSGCLSSEVKKALNPTDNEWAYTLKKLGSDPRLRKDGDRRSLRWFKS